MYNNLYNVTPIFYLIYVMNIYFDSVINFIICVIPIASEFFSSLTPNVSPVDTVDKYRILSNFIELNTTKNRSSNS